jgi:hypothetical protein
MDMLHVSTISTLAGLLYDFLPGSPMGNPRISFPGCAAANDVSQFWPGGSKRPAITQLLNATFEQKRSKFCPLLLSIVEAGIPYRMQKGNPVTREEIIAINQSIAKLGFKIPEFWSPAFLESLPSKQPVSTATAAKPDVAGLRQVYLDLPNMAPHQRGYAFQRFLSDLFAAHGLAPRTPFRLVGEEIDGSFELANNTYLLEAKWTKELTGQADLLVFQNKVERKATWSRGIFVSFLGFSPDGLEAFGRGSSTNIIGMNGLDLHYIVEGKIGLTEAILRKARRAAETNDFFVSLHELL